jgi:hypothetical protein
MEQASVDLGGTLLTKRKEITLMVARRTFLGCLAGGIIQVVSPSQTIAQTSTPAVSESLSDRVPPIEVAPGLFLINYRFDTIASGSIPVFIGEYRNDTGRSFDTPVLGMTFYDSQGNIVGDHYATPVLPVLEDGSHGPVKGEFYEFDPITEPWDSVKYFICSDLTEDYYLEQANALAVHLEGVEEEKGDDSYIAKGAIRNNAAHPVENIGVYAIFRDDQRVFIGYSWTSVSRPIPPGKTIAFEVDVNVNSIVPFDPFDRLEGSEYSVELIVGPFAGGYGINCSSFAPID